MKRARQRTNGMLLIDANGTGGCCSHEIVESTRKTTAEMVVNAVQSNISVEKHITAHVGGLQHQAGLIIGRVAVPLRGYEHVHGAAGDPVWWLHMSGKRLTPRCDARFQSTRPNGGHTRSDGRDAPTRRVPTAREKLRGSTDRKRQARPSRGRKAEDGWLVGVCCCVPP